MAARVDEKGNMVADEKPTVEVSTEKKETTTPEAKAAKKADFTEGFHQRMGEIQAKSNVRLPDSSYDKICTKLDEKQISVKTALKTAANICEAHAAKGMHMAEPREVAGKFGPQVMHEMKDKNDKTRAFAIERTTNPEGANPGKKYLALYSTYSKDTDGKSPKQIGTSPDLAAATKRMDSYCTGITAQEVSRSMMKEREAYLKQEKPAAEKAPAAKAEKEAPGQDL